MKSHIPKWIPKKVTVALLVAAYYPVDTGSEITAAVLLPILTAFPIII